MISDVALDEFKAIWRSQFGEDIADDVAVDEAVNLLTMFDAVYRPLTQEDVDEYEDENANDTENQPISASCKSGAAK